MNKSRIVFHEFFLVILALMMRRREVQEAIDLAGQEIRTALDGDDDERGGEDEGDGIVTVPSPRRVREFYFKARPDEPNQPKGPKL
jgi:hypothetical protein